jgi:hypothetical protein
LFASQEFYSFSLFIPVDRVVSNTVRLRNFCVEAGRGRREAGEVGEEKNKIFILAKSVETLAR